MWCCQTATVPPFGPVATSGRALPDAEIGTGLRPAGSEVTHRPDHAVRAATDHAPGCRRGPMLVAACPPHWDGVVMSRGPCQPPRAGR